MARLVVRNLFKHPVRSLLTVGALVVALFLLCFLQAMLTAMKASVAAADEGRLWVQSAVSLFVDLPVSYQAKIEKVEGVGSVGKWQWFGGIYQDPKNFFGQFAVDPEELFDMYPEIDIVSGSAQDFFDRRTSCVIGQGLADKYGWKVGDSVPLIGALFPKPDGSAWDFQVAAIYEPTKPSFDRNTFFFHWDYFSQTLRDEEGNEPNVGTFVIKMEPGGDATAVMAAVDELFENGPQRVQTTTEAEFNRQFVSMIGNLPALLRGIGGGVLVAIFLACVNTMLMAAREQTNDVGILKALGFSSGQVFRLLLSQSLLVCTIGGGLGIAVAKASAAKFGHVLQEVFFPGYAVDSGTLLLAVTVTLAIGLLSGVVPAWEASRRSPVEDLRTEV